MNRTEITGALILQVRDKVKLLENLNNFFNTSDLIIHSGLDLDINCGLSVKHVKSGTLILKSKDSTSLVYSSKNVSLYGWLDGNLDTEIKSNTAALEKAFIKAQANFETDGNFKNNLATHYLAKLEGDFLGQVGYLSYNTRPSVMLLNRNIKYTSMAYWFESKSDYDVLYWTNSESIENEDEDILPENSVMLLQPTYLVTKWQRWLSEDVTEDMSYSKNKFIKHLENMTVKLEG